MSTPATPAKDFWDSPLHDLFQTLEATPAGLTSDEANRRLRLYGPNSFVQESRFAALFSFLRSRNDRRLPGGGRGRAR